MRQCSGAFGIGEAIDQRKSVAGDLSNVDNPPPYSSLDIPVHEAPSEAVEARVLVRQRSAHPSLDVAHVPQEVPPARRAAQLPGGLAEPVHRVAHVLYAVPHGQVLPRLDASDSGEFGDEGRRRSRPRQAHSQGGLRELSLAPADLLGVARERVHAQSWIVGGFA